jgi:hypothetical protein
MFFSRRMVKILLQSLQNMYESIPRRTVAALRAKGGPTPY